mmetsp:Transcript_94568/g.271227  ORF Transcript_94568/g.271227 Transcript_94568/m.271227 type:complete len:255 (-) Transcript_94568:484-1248(-)
MHPSRGDHNRQWRAESTPMRSPNPTAAPSCVGHAVCSQISRHQPSEAQLGSCDGLRRGPVTQKFETSHVVELEVLQLRGLVVTSPCGLQVFRLVCRQSILRNLQCHQSALLRCLRYVQAHGGRLPQGRGPVQFRLGFRHGGGALLCGRGGLVQSSGERREFVLEMRADLVEDHRVKGAPLRDFLHATAGQGAHERLVHILQEWRQCAAMPHSIIRLALDNGMQTRGHNLLDCGFLLLGQYNGRVACLLSLLLLL